MAEKVGCGARPAPGSGLSFGLILGLTLAAAAGLGCLGARAAAQPASACDTPAESLAAPAPLPHVAAALKKGEKLNILIIGSPIGMSQSQHKPYPAALESLLEHALAGVDVTIADRPVSGETADTAADRMRTEIALNHPDLLIWQVGANDALQFVAPAEYEDTLREGVRWAKDNNVDVLLVGFEANPWLHEQSEARAIREATGRVAQAENVLYLRRYEAMQFLAKTRKSAAQGGNPFSPDIGYDCLAEQVAHALVANMILRRVRPAKP